MLRNSIAFLVALYAIGFALVALTAVRWPSLLMMATLFGNGGALAEISGLLNWRELGLTYGVIYLVAAFFFYSASTLIGRSGRGSVVCYVLGAGIGFPPFLLFDFEPGWWQNPDTFEQCVLFAAVFTVILLGAVLELSQTRKKTAKPAVVPNTPPEILLDKIVVPVAMTADMANVQPKAKPVRRQPVPAAILRQRACFAAYGRRARARQMR